MKSRLTRAQKLEILEFDEPKVIQKNNKKLDSEPNIPSSESEESGVDSEGDSEQENSEISDSEKILVSGSSK